MKILWTYHKRLRIFVCLTESAFGNKTRKTVYELAMHQENKTCKSMTWVCNFLNLVALIIAIFVTYDATYLIVRRDFECAFWFSFILLMLSVLTEIFLQNYEVATRLFLWIVYICFTAPIVFICGRLLYEPAMVKYGVIAFFRYVIVPCIILSVLTVRGFLNFLKDWIDAKNSKTKLLCENIVILNRLCTCVIEVLFYYKSIVFTWTR